MNDRSLTWIRTTFLVALATLTTPSLFAQVAMIRLRAVTKVNRNEIRLADIAQVSMSNHRAVADSLLQADLAVIPEGGGLVLIDKSVIDVRLRLQGLKRHDYRLLGPEQVIVSRDVFAHEMPRQPRFSLITSSKLLPTDSPDRVAEPLSDLVVEGAIQSSLSRQFGMPTEHVKVQLLRPFIDDHAHAETGSRQTRIEVVAPASFPYGRSSLVVRLWRGDRLLSGRTAFVDVRRRQNVLMARKTIGTSTTVDESDVVEEIRFIDGFQEQLRSEDMVGMLARRTIRPGELLTLKDFREQSGQLASEQLIRSRDAVRIIGRRKGLRFVVPAAEALQSGRKGQLIRVRNLHSNKIVVGRVTGRGEVEVPLE